MGFGPYNCNGVLCNSYLFFIGSSLHHDLCTSLISVIILLEDDMMISCLKMI